MPKISKKNICVRNADIEKRFDVIINYNKEYHFYAAIPLEFLTAVDHLTQEELKELRIETFKKKKYDKDGYPIVSSVSEKDCENDMNKALNSLISKTIEKRNVIIIDFKGDENRHGIRSNHQHPTISLALSLTYAVESTSGDKKVYSLFSTYDFNGTEKTQREDVWMNRPEAYRIIDDTPENRIALETLYNALNDLRKKLMGFTANNNVLLDFISSNVKLLQ